MTAKKKNPKRYADLDKQDLARKLSAHFNGDYHIPECLDFIEGFIEVVENTMLEGKSIHIHNFGKFLPQYNDARRLYTGLGKEYFECLPSITFSFRPGNTIKQRMRERSRQKMLEDGILVTDLKEPPEAQELMK